MHKYQDLAREIKRLQTVPQLGILNFLCALEVEARVIPHHH